MDYKALVKSLLIVTVAVATVSFRFIDEECLACGRRECPVELAKPLRKMSIVEWLYDTTGDLHANGLCPTVYTMYTKKVK